MRPTLTALFTLFALAGAPWALAAPDKAPDDGLLSLRTATAAQLAALDGVDEDAAEQIVALRAKRGGKIGSVEELRVIPGIGDATLDTLRRHTAMEFDLPMDRSRTYTSVDQVMAEFADEPTVQQVQGWAARYARVQPGEVEGWLSASRSFALLPELRVEYRLKDGWGQGFQYYPVDGFIDTPNDQVFDIKDKADRSQDRQITLRATWDLDKLVMSSERIRVINEAQDVVKLRDKVLTEVTRMYFERRRLQVDMLLQPKSDVYSVAKDQLKLMELTANLDALTGGTFSKALLQTKGR